MAKKNPIIERICLHRAGLQEKIEAAAKAVEIAQGCLAALRTEAANLDRLMSPVSPQPDAPKMSRARRPTVVASLGLAADESEAAA